LLAELKIKHRAEMHGVFYEKIRENLQKTLDIARLSCYSFMALRRQQVGFGP
jgi:hypothetical protein